MSATEKTPIDFYNLFVDDEIVDVIVTHTNLYAEQEIVKKIMLEDITPGSRINAWKETDPNEIKLFFAILLWMGLDKKPSIGDYWSSSILYQNPISKFMSRNRFELLLSFIHFANNEEAPPGNRLHKIDNLLLLLNQKFSEMYEPGENITIDESMIPYRGRLKFRQYIPNKRHRYGIKAYKLCLPRGYTWHTKLYTGKEEREKGNLTITTRTTMEIVEPLLDEGRVLYTDNYYTSVELAEQLLSRKTHLTGTLRKNRKHNPARVTKAKLRRGEMKLQQHKNKKIVVGKWKDKRDVLFLTTKNVPEMVEIEGFRGIKQTKPSTIVEYNQAKGYIDLSDQLSSYSNTLRRGVKWFRKVAFELLTNTATVNSYRLYTLVVGKRMSIVRFREAIVKSILENVHIMDEQMLLSPRQTNQKHALEESQPKRGRCQICYDKFTKISAQHAMKMSKQVKTSCRQCKYKFMCIECFFDIHHCISKSLSKHCRGSDT